MLDAMQIVFWETSSKIASELLVPIIGLILVMALIYSALGLGARS